MDYWYMRQWNTQPKVGAVKTAWINAMLKGRKKEIIP